MGLNPGHVSTAPFGSKSYLTHKKDSPLFLTFLGHLEKRQEKRQGETPCHYWFTDVPDIPHVFL
jgi:hypothetical protein